MKKLKLITGQYYRWWKMICGNSEFHKPQALPSKFSSESNTYPNDLSSKLEWSGKLDQKGIPQNILADGQIFHFPIAICQKAIAHFEGKDYKTFILYSDWLSGAVNNQQGLDCWSKSGKPTISNYSSMAQGQAISVLVRAYAHTNEKKYLNSAYQAYQFLLSDVGGTTKISNGNYIFDEVPFRNDCKDIVLNGWIFTLWGIRDLYRCSGDPSVLKVFMNSSKYLSLKLSEFDNGYWSLYSNIGKISSPFYHELHINQLKAMNIITGIDEFGLYANKWERYKKTPLYKARSFLVKVWQKLTEVKYNEFIK